MTNTPTKERETHKEEGFAISSSYVKLLKELGFQENPGRNIFFGKGNHFGQRFNYYNGKGFYFSCGDNFYLLSEEVILKHKQEILDKAKEEEYVDFFPMIGKLDKEADELIFSLTILLLKEDSLVYKLLAKKESITCG